MSRAQIASNCHATLCPTCCIWMSPLTAVCVNRTHTWESEATRPWCMSSPQCVSPCRTSRTGRSTPKRRQYVWPKCVLSLKGNKVFFNNGCQWATLCVCSTCFSYHLQYMTDMDVQDVKWAYPCLPLSLTMYLLKVQHPFKVGREHGRLTTYTRRVRQG